MQHMKGVYDVRKTDFIRHTPCPQNGLYRTKSCPQNGHMQLIVIHSINSNYIQLIVCTYTAPIGAYMVIPLFFFLIFFTDEN